MDGDQIIRKGIQLVESGEVDKGLLLINQAITLEPNDPEKIHLRAQIYSALNKYQEAISDYKKAISLKNDMFQYHYNLGNVYYDMKQNQLAIDYYTSAQHLNSYDNDIYSNRGQCYMRISLPIMAYYDFIRAIEINPNDKNAKNGISFINRTMPDLVNQKIKVRATLHQELFAIFQVIQKAKIHSDDDINEFFAYYTVDFINIHSKSGQSLTKMDLEVMIEFTFDFIRTISKNITIDTRKIITDKFLNFIKEDPKIIEEYRKTFIKSIWKFAN